GKDMLSAPVKLIAVVDGHEQVLKEESFKVAKQNNAQIVLESVMAGADMKVKARVTLKFDGYGWYEFELFSDKAKQVDRLFLEVPYRKEITPLYTRDRLGLKAPDSYTAAELPWGGYVPDKGITVPFTGMMRLGNENFGLEYFAESYENWQYADFNRMIEVTPEHLLRLRIIDAPRGFDKPMVYKLGLMATPIKPIKRFTDFMMIYAPGPLNENEFTKMVSPAPSAENLDFWFNKYRAPRDFNSGVVAVYPLRRNINPAEGTIEFRTALDMQKPRPISDLLWLDMGQNKGLRVRWVFENVFHTERNLSLEVFMQDGSSQVINTGRLDWNDGKFHRFALAWKSLADGTAVTVYSDGNKVGEGTFKTRFADVDFSDKYLLLGGNSIAVLDDFRLSGRMLKAEELGPGATLKADASTLILDRFDLDFLPNDCYQTRAEVISGASAETGAWVDKYGEFVKGYSGNALCLSMFTAKSDLEFIKAYGVKIPHVHYWLRNSWGPMYLPVDKGVPARVSEWSKRVRDMGMIPGVYYLKNVSPENDEPYWSDFGYEMCLQPLRPSIRNFVLCPRGSGADFLLYTIDKMMKEYGLGSFHMDYGMPWPCSCREHGCGFYDQNGKLIPTTGINAHREMYKRMYWMTHVSPATDGLVKMHTSDGMIAPIVSFADFAVTAELEQRMPKEGKPLGGWLTLDRFRAFYMNDTQLGVPSYGSLAPIELLHFSGMAGSSTHLIQRYSTMYEGRFNPYAIPFKTGWMNLRGLVKFIFPAYAEFAGGRVLGYWENEKNVSVESTSEYVKATLVIDDKEKKVLLIAANLDGKEQKASIKLKDISLKLDKAVVRDLISREVFDLKDGAFDINIPAENVRLLVIREANR
ncbi:MAG: DUF6067 family protein, partial [bacterium]|nr:DUF6067 family protein [bacterium]